MRACSPSPEVVDNILDWTQSINDETRATFENSYNPSVREAADKLTQQITTEAWLILTPDQQETLNETVAFALQYWVSEEDILAIASDIALNIQSEDDFLYSFMTVVSLRVADNLSNQNVAQGGSPIAPRFHDVAQEVEEVIREGRVTIESGSVEGQDNYQTVLTGSGMAGIYHQDRNKLVHQQRAGRVSLFNMLDRYKMVFAHLVHESVHIYEDIQGEDNTYLASELTAHEIDRKVQLLLIKSAAPVFPDLMSSLLEEERADLESYKVQNIVQGLQCMGYDESIIDFEAEYWRMKEETMSAWNEELGWELMGAGDGWAKGVYTDLLRIRHAHLLFWRAVNMTQKSIGESGAAEDELNVQARQAEQNLAKSRDNFLYADHESNAGAMAAQHYLWSLGSLMVYEQYADRPSRGGAAAEYFGAFDEIADTLLYQTYVRDGI